jgi:hypothetical protein
MTVKRNQPMPERIFSREDDAALLERKAYQCAVREEGEDHARHYLRELRTYRVHNPESFTDGDLERIIQAAFAKQRQTGKTTRVFWGPEPEDEFVFLSASDIVEYRELDRDGFIFGPCEGGRDGIFAARSLHLIQGASASGKTTFALQMLRAQQEGKPFCGRESIWPKDYLVVWQDRGEDELRRQLRNLGMAENPPPYTLVTAAQANMEPAKALEQILSEKRWANVNVVFAEGLDMWLTDDAKSMKVVATQARNVRSIAEQFDVSIIGTIGAPKMKPKEVYLSARDRGFGSSAWSRVADTVVDITKNPETKVRTVSILSRTDEDQVLEMVMVDGLLEVLPPAVTLRSQPDPIPSVRELKKQHGCRTERAIEIQRELKAKLSVK